MKTKIIAIVLLSLIPLISFSQESFLALKAGYNQATLNYSGDPNYKIDPKRSVSFSAVLSNRLVAGNGNLGYSFELGYVQKGAKIDQDTLDYKFQYLNAPILVDYYLHDKIRISIGPEISYLLKAENQSSDSTQSSILDIYSNRLEVSGILSASASVTYFLDIGARYSHSFSKISSYDSYLDLTDLSNSYAQIYLLMKIAN